MAATGRTIGKAEHDVDMKAGLAVIDRDVPDGAGPDLALFVDLDLVVALRGEVEPAHGRPFEGPDRRQRSSGNACLSGEQLQRIRKCLFTGIQNDDMDLRPPPWR